MTKTILKLILSASGFFTFIPKIAEAHEAYVLPKDYFWKEIRGPLNTEAFSALTNKHNLLLAVTIASCILIALFLNSLFRLTKIGSKLHRSVERLAPIGPFLVRIAISAAFFFGATQNSFLGAELSISELPFAHLMQIALYVASFMIFFGLFTEIAAFIGLVVFTAGFFAFGMYLVTYFNYLGELIILLLFGTRKFSFDQLLFGRLKGWRRKWEPYETTLIRVFYGIALIFAGITVKLLHADLTLRVIRDWHLTQFHWLFPSDPMLVVLGAGLAEAVIGIFIAFGFELRFTVLISLFYITLSLFYFKELVWPHILLYGISLNLLVQPEILTLDHFLFKRERKIKSVWQRFISSHRNIGDTDGKTAGMIRLFRKI